MPEISKLPKQAQQLITDLYEAYPLDQQKLIKQAIKVLITENNGEVRLNNDPALLHPLQVAYSLKTIGMGFYCITVCLLHEIPVKSHFIQNQFPPQVIKLLTQVQKVKSNYSEKSLRTDPLVAQQYFLLLCKDLRVALIKIADKIHNLETIEGLSTNRQISYLIEIDRVYLPITEYIGLSNWHQKISNLLLQNRDVKTYQQIFSYLQEHFPNRAKQIKLINKELKTICQLTKVKSTIMGRRKSIASIYKKIAKRWKEQGNPQIASIGDIYAFRIVTHIVDDCYAILSTLQTFYETVPGSHDDYIQLPKKNGYQSLQINLIHPEIGVFEIQIRTTAMEEYNEFGPASHVAYKLAGVRNTEATNDFDWIRKINIKMINYQKEQDHILPLNLFTDYIFATTPKGDIIRLIKGSTPVDFAYAIHTQVGNQCIGTTINGQGAMLNTPLQTHDVVKIIIDKKKKYASKDWLKFVKTGRAKHDILRSRRRHRHMM